MRAQKLQSAASIDVTKYWVSEKLDGVRARWTGKQLISRNGTLLYAPTWFTKNFPPVVLDGELWIARGAYQETVSIISRHTTHLGWKKIKFMLFDLPKHQGTFSARVAAMQQLEKQISSPYLHCIPQFKVGTQQALMHKFRSIIDNKGEGLMLHHQSGLYHNGRSQDLLKLKPYTDAEAIVIGYRAGKGRFTGKMGAIKVKTLTGEIFFIGSGFSHKDRENPPPLNSLITFRHQGYTDSGIPRFAVFIRIRSEP